MDVRQVTPGVLQPVTNTGCGGHATPPAAAETPARSDGSNQAADAAELLLRGKTPEQRRDIERFFALSPADRQKAITYFRAVKAENERWFNSLTPAQQADATRFFALSPADRDKAIAWFRAVAENERRAARAAAAERTPGQFTASTSTPRRRAAPAANGVRFTPAGTSTRGGGPAAPARATAPAGSTTPPTGGGAAPPPTETGGSESGDVATTPTSEALLRILHQSQDRNERA